MECNMPSVGKPMGINRTIDRLTTWFFVGEKDKINIIAEEMLGYFVSEM